MSRQTNVEMLTELMEFSRHGPLMQAFILDALAKWSKHIIAHADDFPEDGIVSKAAWIGCAQELKAKLEAHLK